MTPPEVQRITGWLRHVLPMLDPCDAESLAWEAVWVHGDTGRAALAAKRDAIDMLRVQHKTTKKRGTQMRMRTPIIPTAEVFVLDRGHIDPGFAQVDARDEVACILSRMDPREALVLAEVYLSGRTQVEVAVLLGVTGSRVCQIHRAALRHAREAIPIASR